MARSYTNSSTSISEAAFGTIDMPPEPAGAPASRLLYGLCVARVLFFGGDIFDSWVFCCTICFLWWSFCFYRPKTDRAMHDETSIFQFISFDCRAAHRMMPFYYVVVQRRLDFMLCSIVLFTFWVCSTWSQYSVATPVKWWSQSTAPIVIILLMSMVPMRHAFPGRWVLMSFS